VTEKLEFRYTLGWLWWLARNLYGGSICNYRSEDLRFYNWRTYGGNVAHMVERVERDRAIENCWKDKSMKRDNLEDLAVEVAIVGDAEVSCF
jgi:hypothetical protein